MTIPITKYKGRYRIPSSRLPEWDYGTPGYYFVTICTQKRVPWFGGVIDDQMILSPAGMIAAENLEKIPHIYPDTSIDASVVMPNHIHIIVVIREMPGSTVETPGSTVETPGSTVQTPYYGVSTNTRKWRSGTLGAILGRYKFACTKRMHGMGCSEFAWQARFYDHIIQNEKSLENIRAYILGNPMKWAEDEYYLNR